MSAPKLSVARVGEGQTRIPVGIAVLTWLASWLGGNLLAGARHRRERRDDRQGRHAGLADARQRAVPVDPDAVRAARGQPPLRARERSARTTGSPSGLVDLLGIPIGVASQLVLLRLLYLPLEEAWPDTFSEERLEKTARTLTDSAEGIWVAVLALVIVVGAPFVEELMFRGLLQGAFARRINDVLAMVLVAVWFALIHFRPIEYPGLFAFGLVLGTCALVTRRIGMSIAAHLAFNATGLAAGRRLPHEPRLPV